MTQFLLCIEEWIGMLDFEIAFDFGYTDFAKAFDSVEFRRFCFGTDSPRHFYK